MAKVSSRDAQVNARIVYWGIEGAGKTTNLHAAYTKLRPDHRGELRVVPTRLDPSVSYEVLPIELGDIAGVRTQIELIAVPGLAEQAPTRKQLLDQVDGVVFVVDSQRERIDANIASFEELRQTLRAYGRQMEGVPLLVQYNKRDLADPYALEDLHRKLDVKGAIVFEAVATDGTGVLQTLSTISKRVIRSLREQGIGAGAVPAEPPAAPLAAAPAPLATAASARVASAASARVASAALRMEHAILEEAAHPEHLAIGDTAHETETLLDGPAWEQATSATPATGSRGTPATGSRARATTGSRRLRIEAVGAASATGDGAVRIELTIADDEGRRSSAVLTLRLEDVVEEASR